MSPPSNCQGINYDYDYCGSFLDLRLRRGPGDLRIEAEEARFRCVQVPGRGRGMPLKKNGLNWKALSILHKMNFLNGCKVVQRVARLVNFLRIVLIENETIVLVLSLKLMAAMMSSPA